MFPQYIYYWIKKWCPEKRMPRQKSLFYEHNFFIDYFSLTLYDFIDSMYSMYSIDFIDFIDSMNFLCLYQEKPINNISFTTKTRQRNFTNIFTTCKIKEYTFHFPNYIFIERKILKSSEYSLKSNKFLFS